MALNTAGDPSGSPRSYLSRANCDPPVNGSRDNAGTTALPRCATCSSVPGSSKRWLAPGTTTRRFRQGSRARARRFDSRICSSCPPTIRRVGVTTSTRSPHARSGRPLRNTMVPTRSDRRAAATSAAAGAGPGTEVTQPEVAGVGISAQPTRHGNETFREQLDVEYVSSILGLVLPQQVDEQRRQAGVFQHVGDELVAGTEPAAVAAMGKGDDSQRLSRQAQNARHDSPPCLDLDKSLARAGVHVQRNHRSLSLSSPLPDRFSPTTRECHAGDPAGVAWHRGSRPSSAPRLHRLAVVAIMGTEARSRRPRTSSSVVSEKSSYQTPTAWKESGAITQTHSSTSRSSSIQAEFAAVGTATTRRAGLRRRTAATAARIVEPVASPSSTRITVCPAHLECRAVAAIDPLSPRQLLKLVRSDFLDHAD